MIVDRSCPALLAAVSRDALVSVTSFAFVRLLVAMALTEAAP